MTQPIEAVGHDCPAPTLRQVEFPTDLTPWDGLCLELVDELLHKHPDGEILYIEPLSGPWSYHTALVLDGLVYDAWYPTVRLPPAEYVERVFGRGTPWELNPGADEDGEAVEWVGAEAV